MLTRPSSNPSIRHCPVCGIAMQASRSAPDAATFDHFECLNCRTVIKAPAASDSMRKPTSQA